MLNIETYTPPTRPVFEWRPASPELLAVETTPPAQPEPQDPDKWIEELNSCGADHGVWNFVGASPEDMEEVL